jgi:serine/threonine-protein kinase HipA
MECKDLIFEGLFGVFNDSIPDGWGRLLLDRKLMRIGVSSGDLSPLDRLCYVGMHGMGALIYEPQIEDNHKLWHQDLDEIANEVLEFCEHDEGRFVEDLLALNGSSSGARPKIVTNIDGQDWIIKFRSSLDPKDSGPIEYAYHLMAKAAGLEVTEAKIFASKKGFGYFGSHRFDRVQDKRIHAHTVSGLLHADHRLPSIDYETIMRATLLLTKDLRECEKQLRVAVFNVLSHNRDDHTKNFSFIMDEGGKWRVSPSYDLTFSFGPSGEHCTLIMGEGRNPRVHHILRLAEVAGIKERMALEIIDEVKAAVSKFKEFGRDAGMSSASISRIQTAIKNTM